MILMQGKGVSKGVVKGKLYFFQRPDTTVAMRQVEDVEAEKQRLAQAQETTVQQMNILAEKAREDAGEEIAILSVGTNDLTQYTLACDRQANDLGKFYDPHHPAVLRALKMAADAAHNAGIWIGICGELGADLSLLPTFLALGIDELSVTPNAVLPLRAAIRKSIAATCTLEMLEC